MAQRLQRLPAAPGRAGIKIRTRELLSDQLAQEVVVIDYEDAYLSSHSLVFGSLTRDPKTEGASRSWFTFDRQPAAERLGERGANRQAQPITFAGPFGAEKWIENLGECVDGNT